MLPEDPAWFANSGNHVISKEWTNAVQLACDTYEMDANDGNFPPPSGTTLAWGGMKIAFTRTVGIGAGGSTDIDSTIDWRNRWVMVLDVAVDTTENDQVGESAYSASGEHDCDGVGRAGTSFWTGAGSAGGGPPPASPYGTPIASIHLYADPTNGKLIMVNATGSTQYVWLVLLVSDQFPTRT